VRRHLQQNLHSFSHSCQSWQCERCALNFYHAALSGAIISETASRIFTRYDAGPGSSGVVSVPDRFPSSPGCYRQSALPYSHDIHEVNRRVHVSVIAFLACFRISEDEHAAMIFPESETVEYKSTWTDASLYTLAAFANHQGGTLYKYLDKNIFISYPEFARCCKLSADGLRRHGARHTVMCELPSLKRKGNIDAIHPRVK
jgi:hypothetical protein